MQEISYTCSYVPTEIIMAAGLRPKRMVPDSRPAEADAYMHPNTCYYVKSLLASELAGDAARAAGIVFANSCDGMRRLHDIWNEYVNTSPALFLDVPKKKDPASIEFFASELRRFARNLETEFSCAHVTDKALHEAISVCNNVRVLMDEIFKLQRALNSNVDGRSIFELCRAGGSVPPEEFIDQLKTFISESREEAPSDKEARIVLTGNVMHRPDLINLIENAGGRVVVFDSCTGVRHYDTMVEEKTEDPFVALAERYLTKAPCARMEGTAEKDRRLKKMAHDSGADGVIYSTVKFCDMYLYEAPSMRRACEEANIPYLFLENDYEWSGLEQMKTRIEAFLAIAGGRRSSIHV